MDCPASAASRSKDNKWLNGRSTVHGEDPFNGLRLILLFYEPAILRPKPWSPHSSVLNNQGALLVDTVLPRANYPIFSLRVHVLGHADSIRASRCREG